MLELAYVVALAIASVLCYQTLDLREHNLFLIAEVVVHLVVIVVVELVYQSAANLVEPADELVNTVVDVGEADTRVVAVRGTQISGDTLYVTLAQAFNLGAVVTERVDVADYEEQLGRDAVSFAELRNGSLSES